MEHFDKEKVKSIIELSLSEMSIDLDNNKISDLILYFEMLINRNKNINLISPKQDLETKTVIHLVDSLSPLIIPWPDKISVLDFGSGGGLPAIPLAISYPFWNYTLVESTGKKVDFLYEVKTVLKLNNISLIKSFLEPGRNAEQVYYDLITARGVADLAKLVSIAGPRLKSGSFFLAFKGPNGSVELDNAYKEMKKYSLTVKEVKEFSLPVVNAARMLILFEKY